MRCRWILAGYSIACSLLLSFPPLVADANPSSNNTDMEQSQEWLDQYMLSALIPAGIVVQSRIAAGFEQSIAKAPVVVSIITAKTIRAMGAIDIDQILESVPGLHVSRNPAGYNPIYSFRGVHAGFNPQVLMLVDNMPLTNLFHGDRNQVWGGMPVEAISRVEIIRGPGSALHGADALAGVINIVTKSAEEIGDGEMGLRLGAFNSRDLWLSGSSSLGPVDLSMVAELHSTHGSKAQITADAQTGLDQMTGTQTSYAPQRVNLSRDNMDLRTWAAYRNFTLRAGIQSRNNWGDGAGVAQVVNPNNKFSSQRYNLGLSYRKENFLPHLELDWHISYYRTTQEVEGNLVLYPPGSTGAFFNTDGDPLFPQGFPSGVIGNPEVFEKHSRFALSAGYSGLLNHKLLLGTGYYLGEIDRIKESKNFAVPADYDRRITRSGIQLFDVSDTALAFMPEDQRENSYLYVQDIWQLANDWELTAGVRHDHYSDFGDISNPRLALVWATSLRLNTKLLYGRAFRVPSFAETRLANNPLALGNPNLEPERMTSYELAFDYRWGLDEAINLNFFRYDWDSIIQYVPDSGASTSTAQNIGRQSGYGFELEAQRPVTHSLQLAANYAWQRSRDRVLNADAVGSPERQLYINAHWERDNWQIDLRGNWVMERNRAVDDLREPLEDYWLVDISLRRHISKHFELALLVNNVGDVAAYEPSPNAEPQPFIDNDLPLVGRSTFAEIRYAF